MKIPSNPAVRWMDESVIRDMTRIVEDTGAVNIAQGFPVMPVPEAVLSAAHEALDAGYHRYTRTWGYLGLRSALAEHLQQRWKISYDPGDEMVITCGASEAIMATMLALLSPGDGVILPEPIYENYLPACSLAGARPLIFPTDPFSGEWNPELLEEQARRARVMVLNTPANPTGKVWTRGELETVAEILERHDVFLITDETYAHIRAEDHPHTAPASLEQLYRRTVTIASFSKTYAVTGWRVGFAAAPAPLMANIRKLHDFLTICAPAPFQHALKVALKLPESYYEGIRLEYRARHDILAAGLETAGWRINRPQGGYFLLVDISGFGVEDDREWAMELARTRGVATVPASAFLWAGQAREGQPPDRRGRFIRLSFGMEREALREAVRRLGSPTGI